MDACSQYFSCKDCQICTEIEEIYQSLCQRSGDPLLVKHFDRLVQICLDRKAQAASVLPFLSSEIRAELPSLCAPIECEMEKECARSYLGSDKPLDELLDHMDYADLIDFEVSSCRAQGYQLQHICFIGSGSLPLSAIYFAKRHHIKLTLVDQDQEALDLSERILAYFGIEAKLICADADHFIPPVECDTVFLAALVGTKSADKARIIRNLHHKMSPHQILLLRTAQGIRSLLYTEISEEDVAPFCVQHVFHPPAEALNSLYLCHP